MLKERLTFFVTLMVTTTLCIILLSMVGALLFGLYIQDVDNKEVFTIVSPAFSTIVGGFIGLLAGVKLTNQDDEPEKIPNPNTNQELQE